jgi:hypothetical protein
MSESEENSVREGFIKYAKLLIETNLKAINKLFQGYEVTKVIVDKLYSQDILLKLIKWAEKKDRLSIQQLLISTPNYSDFYRTRLENEYQKYNNRFLETVMTFAEATEKWGLKDSTLRKLATTEKLKEGIDYRKSGKVWLITKEAMIRIYGEQKNK